MKSKLTLVGIVVPILVMAMWVARQKFIQATGVEVTLAVEGFDPRDLLSGHYLRYQVKYGIDNICVGDLKSRSDLPACVCFADATDKAVPNVATWAGECSSRPSTCKVFIKGYCHTGFFAAGIERYYFSDTLTKELAVVPERSAIVFKVGSDGTALVSEFFVDGMKLMDFIEKQK